MSLTWDTAAIWMGMALLASLISVRIGISVALVEICVGIVGGNMLAIQPTPWIASLADFGSVVLTFLAGGEIDLAAMKNKWEEGRHAGGYPCRFYCQAVDRLSAWSQDRCKICRCLALDTCLSFWESRGSLHHVAHVHRLDVRHNLGALGTDA